MTVNVTTVTEGGIGEFLFPDNPAAFIIVVLLFLAFTAWLLGLARSIWLHHKTQNQLRELEDVDELAEARQKNDKTSAEDGRRKSPIKIFDDFINHRLMEDEPVEPIRKHLRTIFLAGWSEGRLETGELIRHTSQQLFPENHLFRAALATFIVFGLLGTLFGLADSLAGLAPIIGNKSAGNSNEAIISGLSQLLTELKSAFAPSIWGVGLTILGIALHGFYVRQYAAPLQQALEWLTLTVWIPKLYPTRSQALQETMEKSFEAAQKVARVAETIESGTEEFSKNLVTANSMTKLFSAAATQLDQASGTIGKAFTENFVKHSEQFSASVRTLSSFEHELKALYQQMYKGSEDFRRLYGETLDKQNTSLESIVTSLKSYEAAYIEKREKIDTSLYEFINEAKSATTSVSESNRKLVEALNAQLVGELNKVQTVLAEKLNRVQEAMDVGFSALNDAFERLRQPFDHTADTIRGTFENFDKAIKGYIHDDIITHFKIQHDQNKTQLDSIHGLNTTIEKLLTLLAKNSGTQTAQLNHLNATLANFTPALAAFGGALKSLPGDMQNVIGAVNQLRNLKPYTPQAVVAKPKSKPRDEGRPRKQVVIQVEGSAESILMRSWKWLRSRVMEEEGIAVGSTRPKETVKAETSTKKADEVIIVKDADLKMEKEVTATDDNLLKETDSAETSPKKVDEVIVVNDDDLKIELLDNKNHP
jgi:hypothetical protein